MAPAAHYILLATFILALVTLAVTSYTDVRRRTINSFIFIPLVGMGVVFQATQSAPLYFIIMGVLLFMCTFLETDLVIYPVIGMIFLAVSLYFVVTGSIFYGFTATIMSLMLLLGFQERFFGIGDIKAMIALFFAFTALPFTTPATAGQLYLVSVVPLSMIMLFNIAIASLFFIPYVVLSGRKKGDRTGLYSITSMKYDEELYRQNPARFNLRERPGGKVMVYKAPFMVSVFAGFLVTVLAGFWFIFL